MFVSLEQDRATIERKYHIPGEKFDAFQRMNYHGYAYDEATGLDDARMDESLAVLSKKLQGQPHPVHKAKLFAYVLDHTRIDVNAHDYFIGVYSWGHPISKYTVRIWEKEVAAELPEATAILQDYEVSGVAYGGLDYDHTVPDWDSLMALGFSGLLTRARERFQALEMAGTVTEKQKNFFTALEIEYEAVIRFLDRLYRYTLTKDFAKAPKIAECLQHLRDGAPTNIYEALQLIYIYFMLSESVEHYQVRSLGHGLDGTLYPFFVKDMKTGTFTKEEVAELLGYFFLQWSAIGNYWGQPFYLGGMKADGTTKVNELSYLILDTYDRLGIYNPKIQIKVSKGTPRDFILKALDMIRHGVSSIVFCNDGVIVKSMMSRGATYEEAVDTVISGCYEYKRRGKGIDISGSYFNALKPVSLVLDNGFDTVSGKQIGLQTGTPETLTSFEAFYRAYLAQLKHCVETYLHAMHTMETRIGTINPSLLFSGTSQECISTMTDAIDGGMENTSDTLLSGLGTTVDALMAVYELVYEKKLTTLEELKRALDADWVGYETLRAKALSCNHKFGNGDAMADNYAAAIVRFMHDLLSGKQNSHGGQIVMELHSARAFLIHGEKTKATPDGRRLGDEMSKNASPTPGADRKGVTALIHSVTQIDTALTNNGFCLDAMLHPSAVQGEDGLAALYAVLSTYMNKGGASIHFNIFDAALLRNAQKHPEKYQNLQVRVCGWNVLWNNMNKTEQDAYILRAEHIQA